MSRRIARFSKYKLNLKFNFLSIFIFTLIVFKNTKHNMKLSQIKGFFLTLHLVQYKYEIENLKNTFDLSSFHYTWKQNLRTLKTTSRRRYYVLVIQFQI